ncbi:MAG: ABC transporter ATP-binding protein [Deltaproteobacteria bacterium]|nr:ABC transporter ATP-binding protein [Deltaproteobacteria bacterium]
MAVLQTRRLEAKFPLRDGVVHALRGIDLDIATGEFFVLLGPSGCGKTTMLRSIAGLERPTAGEIRIDGHPIFDAENGFFVPPDQRPIAMVFQSYAIWPHMDVFENIAFPLRRGRLKMDKESVRDRVGEVLEMLGLDALAARPVITLSGGQQQRVALARALALQPRILLMDEPLSNLDFKLQVRLRAQMRDLMHRLNLTTIHVTHNQAEALETGDRIAVMSEGRIVQIGDPQAVYHRPENEFVARFIGDMNIFPAVYRGGNGDTARVETAFGQLDAQRTAREGFAAGASCMLGIRPEDIEIDGDIPAEAANLVTGTVASSSYVGEGYVHTVESCGQPVRVRRHHREAINRGDSIRLHFPPAETVVVAPSDGLDMEGLEGGLAGEEAARAN